MVNGKSPTDQPEAAVKTSKREAYFLEFATEVRRRHPDLILMLTGGFRSLDGINSALDSEACNLIGIGRPATIATDFPKTVLGIGEKQKTEGNEKREMLLPKIQESKLAKWFLSPTLRRTLRGGAETKHYCDEIHKVVNAGFATSAK
jgi:2,4-dienoyl-CoA reductase-like NADH-dependent reductase (Old Yellow Enzyme family)